jgi:hypothetical protein
MNASSGVVIQKKVDLIAVFFELTSSAIHGWRRELMIVWSGLQR